MDLNQVSPQKLHAVMRKAGFVRGEDYDMGALREGVPTSLTIYRLRGLGDVLRALWGAGLVGELATRDWIMVHRKPELSAELRVRLEELLQASLRGEFLWAKEAVEDLLAYRTRPLVQVGYENGIRPIDGAAYELTSYGRALATGLTIESHDKAAAIRTLEPRPRRLETDDRGGVKDVNVVTDLAMELYDVWASARFPKFGPWGVDPYGDGRFVVLARHVLTRAKQGVGGLLACQPREGIGSKKG